jgi:chromosomal replication initiation ATPase DnaA
MALTKVTRHGFAFYEVVLPPEPPLNEIELPRVQPKEIFKVIAAAKKRERAQRKLEKLIPPGEPPPQIPKEIAAIQNAIMAECEILPPAFYGKTRLAHIALPRHASMALCRKLTHYPLHEIARCHNKQDHANVIYACKRFAAFAEDCPRLKLKIDAAEAQLRRASA